jgi:hypothetical protein
MNGLKFAASGFVGRAPTMSGNSCGGFALSIVDILQELERMGQSARALQYAIHWARLSPSQFLDPAGNFTLFSASNDRHTSQQTCARNSLSVASS